MGRRDGQERDEEPNEEPCFWPHSLSGRALRQYGYMSKENRSLWLGA